MAATYEPIATTTLGSAQANVTFSSLGSYTDIVLVMDNVNVTTAGNYPCLQFNNDTGTNYSMTSLEGNGTTTYSNRLSNQSLITIGYYIGSGGTAQANYIVNIQNYSNSTTYKTVIARENNLGSSATYPGAGAVVGLWRSTSAITSIKILSQAGNLNSGSTFTLYGIKASA